MKNTLRLYIFLGCILFAACRQKPVTHPTDYVAYLSAGNRHAGIKAIDEERCFWQSRLQETPGDLIAQSKIAGLLTRRFSYSGIIAEVHTADSLYRLVNQYNRTTSSGTFRSLAANCITQHRFLQAQQYIDSALALGDDQYLTRLMEFDVAMEMGNRYRARAVLNSLADKKSFEYLIREAKYKDHVAGDLDAAIVLMEQAREELTTTHQPALHTWITSNLGDLYGHANRYAESYRCYLQALATDPNCYHAWKGIAWLAFSHDKDVIQAKKIIAHLQQQHPVPDYELLLAEIADYEKDTLAQQYHQHTFMRTVQHSLLYGDMYNKYLFDLQAAESGHQQQLLQIAKREVQNRPTAETYSWLAWAYCANGDIQKAMETVRLHVQNKSFEPAALYYMGLIYRAGGNKEAARKYLSEAKNSAYELGPGTAARIQQLLNDL